MIDESTVSAIAIDGPDSERRLGEDRRQGSLRANFRYWLLGGRRRGCRRETDSTSLYVDRYDSSLVVVTLGVLILSCLDAMMTLRLLGRGAVEANPLMDYLIQKDIGLFIKVKIALTGLCVVLLAAHAQFQFFRRFQVRQVIYSFFVMYLLLFSYEIALMLMI